MIVKINRFQGLISFLLAFFVNLNPLLTYLHSNGSLPELLSDVDEAYYLGLPNAAVSGKYNEFYYNETPQKDLSKVLISAPNAITDLVVGLTLGKLISNPVLLGLVLDILCCWLTLILSYRVFHSFFNEQFIALIGAFFYTFSPFAYAITLDLFSGIFNLFSGKYFKFFGYYTHQIFPIQRGIYTQLSLVLCNFALLILIQSLQEQNKKKTLVSAIFFGSLIYVYPFTWLFAVCNSCFLVVMIVLLSGDIKRKIIYYSVNFFIPLFVISVPGLILASRMEGQFYIIENLPKVVFFQPLSLIILIIQIIVYQKERGNSKARIVSLFIISLFFSEIFLLNLEAMGFSKFTIWHPLIFFLNPLIGTILFLQITSRIYKVSVFKRIVQVLMIVLVFSKYLLCIYSSNSYINITANESSDFLELVDYVKANTNLTEVFSLASFNKGNYVDYRQMPNSFSLITGRSILSQYLATPHQKNLLDSTWREIYSYYLLYHQFSLFDNCEDVKNRNLLVEPRLYSLPYRVTIKIRKMQCNYVEGLSENEKKDLLAQFTTKYKVNYILIENKIYPDWQNNFKEKIWISKNGYFALIKVS